MTASFVRFATTFSLLAATLYIAVPSASAQDTSRNENPFAYILSTGAYAYAVVDNYDSDNNGTPNYSFMFSYITIGTLRGTVDPALSVYGTNSIAFFGRVGTGNRRFETTYYKDAGHYGLGSATMVIYDDTNGNKQRDVGERTIVNIPQSRPMRVTGAVYSGSR